MAFEEMKAAVAAILDEIAKRPDDRHVLQEQLREKIAEFEALGLPVPADFRKLMDELDDDDEDDMFDNMPV